jgi:hypothetical protein
MTVSTIIKWMISIDGSQAIYNLSFAFGAFFGGIAALKVIFNWNEELRIKAQIRKYRKKYPADLFGKPDGLDLIRSPENPGEIHIMDHRNRTQVWVANPETFRDLTLSVSQIIESNNENVRRYRQYTDMGEIITRGQPERP